MSAMLWGLVLIILAWSVQFFASLKNQKQIQPSFLVLYSLGSLLLVVDAVGDTGLTTNGLLQIGTLFLVLLVWFKSK